jgi:DNA-binding PucR family transcriptional regulator
MTQPHAAPAAALDALDALDDLLASLGPQDRLRDFCESHLGALREYDRAHGAQLVETLDAYFAAGRSLAGTAQLLGTHRNTVLYRIRRIEEVARLDLRNPQVELALQLALRIGAALGTAQCKP